MSQGLFCGQTESFMDELETFLFLGLKIDAYDAICMQNFPGTSTSVDSNRGHLFVLLLRVVAPLGFILLHLLIANVKQQEEMKSISKEPKVSSLCSAHKGQQRDQPSNFMLARAGNYS
ncbi:uncharacterized protein A4U43_C07F15600 [Asparagus officinalis]|uniref:Uncharacterized protein n=1 Tax=Asparagus officinalis TaxID=4686 RepID=A0A5P1EFJ9_ASPOF|nr:uncharacterized protein A4U43_C07F15600 [Asparagus officinalis]